MLRKLSFEIDSKTSFKLYDTFNSKKNNSNRNKSKYCYFKKGAP